ncbi:hypothetical protein E4U21_002471 [Claviceps maximensis]|nr:hypothetical protein E4U21_002471 [Claviceps maximensis]
MSLSSCRFLFFSGKRVHLKTCQPFLCQDKTVKGQSFGRFRFKSSSCPSSTTQPKTAFKVDYSNTQVTDAWRTKRLEFIKIDASNESIMEFLPQIEQDPVVLALASRGLMVPQGDKDMRAQLEAWSNALLGVAICLREDVGGGGREDDATMTTETKDNSGGGRTREKSKPTVVGIMCMGWGGINARTAQHRTAQMGMKISKEHQRKGYGPEALTWMVDWAFTHAGLHTVSLTVASFHRSGIHLYRNMGFRYEGTRKETIFLNRAWHDELNFGMTEQEWEALRAANRWPWPAPATTGYRPRL